MWERKTFSELRQVWLRPLLCYCLWSAVWCVFIRGGGRRGQLALCVCFTLWDVALTGVELHVLVLLQQGGVSWLDSQGVRDGWGWVNTWKLRQCLTPKELLMLWHGLLSSGIWEIHLISMVSASVRLDGNKTATREEKQRTEDVEGRGYLMNTCTFITQSENPAFVEIECCFLHNQHLIQPLHRGDLC